MPLLNRLRNSYDKTVNIAPLGGTSVWLERCPLTRRPRVRVPSLPPLNLIEVQSIYPGSLGTPVELLQHLNLE